ncbi:probable histone h2a.2, partial [Phtheirospermum japonicum]
VLELAGNAARDNKKKRIIPRHFLLAVRNGEELGKLLDGVRLLMVELFLTSTLFFYLKSLISLERPQKQQNCLRQPNLGRRLLNSIGV